MKGLTGEMRGQGLSIVLTAILLNGICLGFEDEGFQWWSTVGGSFGIAKNWKGTYEQEIRMGDDGGNFYYEHTDAGFVYSGLAKWLDVGANFRYISEKNDENGWVQENRPHLNATLKGRMFGLSVSDRNRIEYRDREEEKDVWRYQNKLTVTFPFELTALKLKPYVADSIFITLNDDNIDENRVYSGFICGLTEWLDLDLYFMWDTSRSDGEWKDIKVLGTSFKLRF